MLLLLLLMMMLVKIGSVTVDFLLCGGRWMVVVVGCAQSFSCQTQLMLC